MKKMIALIFALAIMGSVFAMAEVTKEQYVIEGQCQPVWVEQSVKMTKKSTVVTRSYFTENYMEYLGMEMTVNGEVMVDTFFSGAC